MVTFDYITYCFYLFVCIAGMLSKVLPLRRQQAAIEQKKYDSLSPAGKYCRIDCMNFLLACLFCVVAVQLLPAL